VVVVGTADLVERECGPVPDELRGAHRSRHGSGCATGHGGWNDAVRGVIAVEDRKRVGWTAALGAFADREVVILTGDERTRADRFRDHPAVDRCSPACRRTGN